MGWWRTSRGMIGDAPADIVDLALKNIESVYLECSGRLPTQGEVADLIQFCTCGTLKVECGDSKYPFSKVTCWEDETPRLEKCGAQGALGQSTACGCGEIVNVDPTTGDHYERGEIQQVIEKELEG